MHEVIIENSNLNTIHTEGSRHFKISDEIITNEIVKSRQINSNVISVAKLKMKGGVLRK